MSSTPSDAVIVWGEILWDRFEHGDELGGAPANVAWHLGLAGGWPRLVSRVGDDDAGRRAIARLGEVVDADLVQLDRARPTGEVRVEVVGGEPRYRLVPGCAWEAIECTADVRRACHEAGALVYGSLAQRAEGALAQWRAAVEAAAATCVKVCDVNLRAGDGDASHVREAIEAADIVKVNDRELAWLADWRGWADPITELRKRRAKVLAVTHGAAGSTLFSEGRTLEIPAERAEPGGDHVGCGDAYLAILVHGMTCGWDLEASGRAAARWAAAVAGVRGATPWFSEEQAADLLEAA